MLGAGGRAPPWQFAGRAPRSDRRGVDDEYEAACAVSGSQWGRAEVDGCASPAIRVGQARRSGNVEGRVGRCPGPAVRFGSDGRGARARGGPPPPNRRPPAPVDRRRRPARRRGRGGDREADGAPPDDASRRSSRPIVPQHVALHGSYFHVRVATEADREPSESPHWLDLVAADNVVLTSHAEPVAVPPRPRRPGRGRRQRRARSMRRHSSRRRSISAVTSYFKSVDEIEDEVERLDRRALSGRPGDDVLADLVALRRRIGRLRRVLSDERDVFAAFRAADFGAVAPGDDSAAFQALVGPLRVRPRERRAEPRPA